MQGNAFLSVHLISIFLLSFLILAPPGKTYAANEDILMMGKMEFRGKADSLPQWTQMLARHRANTIFEDNSSITKVLNWKMIKDKISPLPKREQLNQVNLFWNQWPYRLDEEAYQYRDYWASPYEFVRNSGDCEDYAIVKYFTLKELGFPVEDMRILIVRETIRNIAHAVLAVYIEGDILILDNLNNSLLSHTRYRNYDAQYSVNEQFRWGYVAPKK